MIGRSRERIGLPPTTRSDDDDDDDDLCILVGSCKYRCRERFCGERQLQENVDRQRRFGATAVSTLWA